MVTVSRLVVRAVLLAMSVGQVGCGAPADDGLAAHQEPIYNGTTVTTTGLGHAYLRTKQDAANNALVCGATPLTNLWVLTAQHCPLTINATDPSYTTEITLDYNLPSAQPRRAVQFVLHPTWDVALVKVDSAFDINGSPGYPNFYGYAKRMYPWSDLLNQTVMAWGYGANAVSGGVGTGYGVLRQGTLLVAETDIEFSAQGFRNPALRMTASTNQQTFGGDGGGAITYSTLQGINTLAAVPIGVQFAPDGSPSMSFAIPTEKISQWAIKTIYPNRALACHGVECMTTQTALANNSGLDTSWAPCGGYRSSWEARVSLENNADFFYVNGRALTGDNTFTGIAPAGTIQLQLRTNGSVQSAGVKWLRVRCIQ